MSTQSLFPHRFTSPRDAATPYASANTSSLDAPRCETTAQQDASSEVQTWAFDIVILGAGAGGTAVARHLSDPPISPTVALVEPSSYVYDQPEWMDVGTSAKEKEETRHRRDVPGGTIWIRGRAVQIDPDARRITMDTGDVVEYETLVVATGVEIRWDRLRGVQGELGTGGVCSVYGYDLAERTWEMIRSFSSGRAVFTATSSPYKGGTAPRQVLRQAVEVWRDRGVIDQVEVVFATAWSDAYAGGKEVDGRIEIPDARAFHLYTGYDLLEVRPDRAEAVFSIAKDASQSERVIPFDLLHIVPPMRPPAVVAHSPLAHSAGPLTGFLDVRPDALRHPQYKTVYGVGDVIGVQDVKTRAAAREHAQRVATAIREQVEHEGAETLAPVPGGSGA